MSPFYISAAYYVLWAFAMWAHVMWAQCLIIGEGYEREII